MNEMLAQLTPQERRIVVAIGMVVIFVLNLLFVWPHFGEWKRLRNELLTMRGSIAAYNKEIALDINPNNGLQKQLAKLERQEGAGVMDEKVQLQSTIMTQSRRTGVNVANYIPGLEKADTNGFFEEETIKITVDSQEPQLVDFLYNIGGDPAMIRVSELELSPVDQNRYRLRGAITLTANYAKRAPAPGTPAAAKPGVATGTRPGGPPTPGVKPALPGQKPTLPPNKQPLPGQAGKPRGMTNGVPKGPFAPKLKVSG